MTPAAPKVRAVVRRSLPRPVRRLLVLDARGTVSLGLWLVRRRHGVPAGAVALPYAGAVLPLLVVLTVVIGAELVLVDVVLRALGAPGAVRGVLFVLDAWSLVLALGVLAATVTRPHVVTPTELRIRNGAVLDLRIPRRSVDRVVARPGPTPGTGRRGRAEDGVLRVAVASTTNLVVELHRPVTVERALGSTVRVHTVEWYADDPRAALAALAGTDQPTGASSP